MDYTGKVQLAIIINSPAALEADGDRIFTSHAAWMERTHHRDGEKALLQYNVSKSRDDDGNVIFVLAEVYATAAGVEDHVARSRSDWEAYDDWGAWLSRCQVTAVLGAPIVHSLW